MSDWRTEGPAADETAGAWLLEAWLLALGFGALMVRGLSAKA